MGRCVLFFLLVVLLLVSVVSGLPPLTPAQKAEISKRDKALRAKQRGKPLTPAQKRSIERDVRAIKVAKKPTNRPSKKPVAPISYKKGGVTAVANKPVRVTSPGASDTLEKTSGASKAENMRTKADLSEQKGRDMDMSRDPYAHDDGYANQPYKESGYPDGENAYSYDDVMSGGKPRTNLRAKK